MLTLTDELAYPEIPLDAALLYGVLDWRVAPVRVESKVPAISEWTTRASSAATAIRGWWDTLDYANCGVCIVTGRQSGLWVLDVDVAGGKPGKSTLRQLMVDHDCTKLPETVVAVTPSGGLHYYFKYPEDGEVHNSASNRLGPGLDVRGEGGQVNAPPTIRAQGSYRWAPERGPYDAEVAEAPAWLLELVMDRAAPPDPPHMTLMAQQIVSEALTLGKAPDYVTSYNDTTNWETLLAADGWILSHSDGLDVSYWVRPGKEAREGISASTNYAGSDLIYVWTTSLDWLPAERAYDRYGYMVHRDFGGDFKAAADTFVAHSPAQTGVDLLAAPTEVAHEGDEEELSRLEQAEIHLSSAAFWDGDPAEDEEFLISPFIAVGRGHALFAEAKAGKSYVVLQALAAAAIPHHTSWADPVARPVDILYLDYEMTENDLRERLEIFGFSREDDFTHLRYVKASMLGADLDTHAGGLELLHQAQKWHSSLVVIDTMSRAVSGDENDADTVRKFYQHTGRLLKANGIAWLRIDHAGKDKERGQRGSSGKNDDVDIVWRLDRLDGGALLELTHSRVFWMPTQIQLATKESDDTGDVIHVRAANTLYSSGVHDKAAQWRNLGVPLDATRRQATALGFRCKASLFSQIKRFVNQDSQRQGIADLVPNQTGTREPREPGDLL